MKSATLTPEAKEALRKTVRSLRERLLRDIREAAEATYRLSVSLDKAGLDEAPRVRRQRLEAWLDEQTRAEATGKKKKDEAGLRQRFLRQAEKQAASTLLNRLVFLRHIEALGLSSPHVLTGGWSSPAYKELREFAPALCSSTAGSAAGGSAGASADDTEGYGLLLRVVFDELAHDLPGLFGDVGLTRLFPIPAPTLRAVVEALDDAALEPAWTDDTTLGWVYQFYNDPEREALDAKINDGGKIEPHEIASKTQMFTERYMVEWLLHNSLGQMWLAMCAREGWRADFEAVREALDARRAAWRAKREAGEVSLEALMPIESDLEDRWKYWVPQPLPDDAVANAPATLRELKLLDPACGSGHFLVVAFDLLAALYREEARHRGESWSDGEIAQWIVENNLHGVDIDPRAVQLAAAGLWVKAKQLSRDVELRQVNLVAPVLKLAGLPEEDPALMRLKADLHREVGIEPAITQRLVAALAGVDHLGTLLKVDTAIDEALAEQDQHFAQSPGQGDLFLGFAKQPVDAHTARISVLDRLERFLDAHAAEGDLGLRLEGEQLASGIRFIRLARENTYDLVLANPPYQGASKMAEASYLKANYPRSKADLFAVFLERSLQLLRDGGLSAMITMRAWMFLSTYTELRKVLTHEYSLKSLGDVGWGAFADMTDNPVVMSVAGRFTQCESIAQCPTSPTDRVRTDEHYFQTVAGLWCQVGRHEFDARAFEAIEGEPIVYWWSADLLRDYAATPKLAETSPALNGLSTQNNVRFVRLPWECGHDAVWANFTGAPPPERQRFWVPYIKGADGAVWFEPLRYVIPWGRAGLMLKNWLEFYQAEKPGGFVKHEDKYFVRGVAFSTIGAGFSARAHVFSSVFGHMGSSVFTDELEAATCLMNSSRARFVLESLNPGVHFLSSDVNRLPAWKPTGADLVFNTLENAFLNDQATVESSVLFRQPASSLWHSAQEWAQRAVDRAEGESLPPYEPEYDEPEPSAWVSFAIGVALGRFGADGEGILDEAPADALPAGILFVSAASHVDSLAHPACQRIADAWGEHGAAIEEGAGLGEWLRKSFFSDVHRKMYENRPIYFPLSSAKKSFVAWVSIHRWTDTTLSSLLAEHLLPAERALEGELDDLNQVRAGSDKAEARVAEKRHAQVVKLREELAEFIALVRQCAEKGPPPTDSKCPPRERDAPFAMDLDDGVMVNSAALWPLLQAQWRDPKKWWKELASAKGKKDYDWSHLAARYFPTRVDEKCQADPSLGVAHGCFWKYHPQKAHAWELRLQEEIAPNFTLSEPDSNHHRAAFLQTHPDQAAENEAKEQKRRDRKQKKEASK